MLFPLVTPVLNITGSFSTAPPAYCADGKTVTPSPLFNSIFNAPTPNSTVNAAQDLSGLHGVGAQGFINMYPAGEMNASKNDRTWKSSLTTIYPTITGGGSWGYIKANGGCWQAVDLNQHEANLRTGIDAQIPPDFAGYVAYDLEGAPPIMGKYFWGAYKCDRAANTGPSFTAAACPHCPLVLKA